MRNTFENQLKGKKILFASVPAEGHFNPLTGLAKYLQEAGCDIRWYTSAIFEGKLKKLNIPHYSFKKALDINAQNIYTMIPELKIITEPGEKLNVALTHFFIKRAPEYLADLEEIRQSFPFDLMIASNMFSAIPLVKTKLPTPVVAIGVIPLAQESANLAPYGTALPPAKDETERKTYDLLKIKDKELFKSSIDTYEAILNAHNVPHTRASLIDLLIKQADLYLQIGSPDFEYQRNDLSDHVKFIGALKPYEQPNQENTWFDNKLKTYKKIVLVTQGTVENDVTKLLEPTIKAFINTDVLVVATTAGNRTSELKAKYNAENIIIADYIPFKDIMPYASVYVTNGGYGGTLLSITNKLPMVAAGIHELKNEICARIDYFKIGIDLRCEKPSPDTIFDAVQQVMTTTRYKTNITQLAEKFSQQDPNALAAHNIAGFLRNDKS